MEIVSLSFVSPLLGAASNEANPSRLLYGALVAFFLILLALLLIRRRRKDFEVRSSDVLVAVIPIAIWLVGTGKVKLIEFGGFKIESAFEQAASASVKSQVAVIQSSLPVDPVRATSKSGTDDIPRLIENKSEALSFTVGVRGYDADAVATYLQRLSEKPYFKYLLIVGADGTFVGLANGREIASLARSQPAITRNLVEWLENSRTNSLAELPGYVSAAEAITQDSDRLAALDRMETLNRELLPVLDSANRLSGVVSRSRLVAGLVQEVVRRIK